MVKKEYVCEFGTMGSKFYIILQGSVGVHVPTKRNDAMKYQKQLKLHRKTTKTLAKYSKSSSQILPWFKPTSIQRIPEEDNVDTRNKHSPDKEKEKKDNDDDDDQHSVGEIIENPLPQLRIHSPEFENGNLQSERGNFNEGNYGSESDNNSVRAGYVSKRSSSNRLNVDELLFNNAFAKRPSTVFIEVSTLDQGKSFGELALIQNKPR